MEYKLSYRTRELIKNEIKTVTFKRKTCKKRALELKKDISKARSEGNKYPRTTADKFSALYAIENLGHYVKGC